MIDAILTAFANVAAPTVLLALILGVLVGVVIGALPGLSATMAMAVFSPATFFLPPVEGISFLLALYKGGTFGGSLSAILIGTPGTASNAATVADGYAMTRDGKAGRALGLAVWGSVVGDGIGILTLLLFAPLVAEFALHVGNAEKFAITVMSLTLVAYVSGASLMRGIFAAAIGLALTLAGTDPIGGSPRLTFGVRELSAGIGVIPLAIGLFGMAEVMDQLARWRPGRIIAPNVEVPLLRDILRRLWEVKRTIARSSLIGASIGALPGIGSETSNWVAYALARRASDTPEAFGRGADEGVVAPEVACNATCGAALIPTLIFGIPGDIVTSILMGALIAQGLQPGPTLITENTELFYTLYAGLFVSMIMLAFVGLAAMRFASRIILIPRPLLFTSVGVLCVAGTYAINARLFDVGVMLAAGFAGWAMRGLRIPVAPLVLAFVLGGILEDSFRRMLIQSRGSLAPLWERPIAAGVCLVTLAVLAFALKGAFSPRRATQNPVTNERMTHKMKREILADGVTAAFAEYPLAVEAHGLVFVSGMRGGRPEAQPYTLAELPEEAQHLGSGYGLVDAVEGPVIADAWTAFENLSKVLAAAGSDQSQILRLHIWQDDKRWFPRLEQVRMVWQPVPCPSSGLGVSTVCGQHGRHYGLSAVAAAPGVSETFPGRDVVKTFDNQDYPSASFYSQAVRTGPLIFLAGHIPIRTTIPGKPVVAGYDDIPEEGRAMATGRSHPDSRHGPIAAQTWFTYDEIRKNLAAQGLGMDHIVQLTIFLADLRDFPDFLRVHEQFFPAGGPAITVTGFDEVGHKGTLLEIEPVAVNPEAGLKVTSHAWQIPAPLPGAAAVSVDRFCFLSGMIGLTRDGVLAQTADNIEDPRGRTLVEELSRFERIPGLSAQCWATFERLAETLDAAGLNLDSLVKLTVFLADPRDFLVFEAVRRAHLSENLPAMEGICVFGPGPIKGAHVQIEAIAVEE